MLELLACGCEVTGMAAEGACQKAKRLKWLRPWARTMAKGDLPKVN